MLLYYDDQWPNVYPKKDLVSVFSHLTKLNKLKNCVYRVVILKKLNYEPTKYSILLQIHTHQQIVCMIP
jgi:hypothetical protein